MRLRNRRGLTSGKVSALALRDRGGPQVLFDRTNRNHKYLYRVLEAITRLPPAVKLKIITSMPAHYKYTKPLFGRTGRGIPGYTRDWMEESTRDSSRSF